ncbi:MAG TPA: hypothetical protein VFC19_52460 [Candidatus Limnocylindrales bacterium]|nr:hypothetical protein [Candidatus Limnocylindrales bacterium]
MNLSVARNEGNEGRRRLVAVCTRVTGLILATAALVSGVATLVRALADLLR